MSRQQSAIVPQELAHERRGWVELTYRVGRRKLKRRVGYQIPHRLLCVVGQHIDPGSVCLYVGGRDVLCIHPDFVRKVIPLPADALPDWAHELERD